MIYGDISTGAQNDLERATEIARSMVMDYGMSDLGRVNYRESARSPFIATSGEERVHSFSEETAREIDKEVRRILDESLSATADILEVRKDALVAVAETLIDIESMDGTDLARIIDEHTTGPKVVPGTDTAKRSNGIPDTTNEGNSEQTG
jgi:cell division protease FtsH